MYTFFMRKKSFKVFVLLYPSKLQAYLIYVLAVHYTSIVIIKPIKTKQPFLGAP